MSINIEYLKESVDNFKRFSTPNDCNSYAPCSKQELTVAVSNCAKLFKTFISELEKL